MSANAPLAPVSGGSGLNGWIFGGGAVLAILFLFVAGIAKEPNEAVRDAAAALVLISAAAVGIERFLEIVWDFVDNTVGSFWPLSAIDKRINELVQDLTHATAGPIARLQTVAQDAVTVTNLGETQAAAFAAEVKTLQVHLADLSRLAPNSYAAQAVARYGDKALAALAAKYPKVKTDIEIAQAAATATSTFIGSLTDNPGRRVLSIYAGSMLGLAVAGVLSLDMFNAILGNVLALTLGGFSLKLGIAATGLIMGVGANPTHEAIKLLQRIKEKS
jgi:hypothetical protein